MKLKTMIAALAMCAPLCAFATDSSTLVLSGLKSQYRITPGVNGFTITDLVGLDGTHQVSSSTRVQFTDTNIALDLDGNAGKAFRLYQAAFNRAPDLGGLGFWIDTLDRSATLGQVASGFIRSGEFIARYGENPTPENFVNQIYTNVLHRAPDAGGYAYWVDVIKKGASLESVLANISESTENKSLVQTSISSGIEFTPMPVASGAAGIWEGSTSSGRKLAGVVLDNGSFWMLYSKPNDSNSVVGLLAGTGATSNNKYASDQGYDFNLEGSGLQSTSMSATFAAQQSFNGNISTLGTEQNLTFTTSYNNTFTQAPSLADVAGNFLGIGFQRSFSEAETIRIGSDGVISSTVISACRVSGSISPRSNVSAYNFSLTFGGAPCHSPNSTVTGIGYYDKASRQFYAISINSSHNDGYIFAGAKL